MLSFMQPVSASSMKKSERQVEEREVMFHDVRTASCFMT